MPVLDRITIYPIKSLDGLPVVSARVLPGGSLEHDREFAMFSADGHVVNGKKYPSIHLIRTSYDLHRRLVTLDREGAHQPVTFHFDEQRSAIEAWMGEFFGFPVEMRHDPVHGFPDDREAPGPTVVSKESLAEVESWYHMVSVDELRMRFRPNLEVSGSGAFWEDRLYGNADEIVEFRVGGVRLIGCYPCARCVVPTRNPRTSEVYEDFQRTFVRRRRRTLPRWAPTSRFDHYYRFTVNTRRAPGAEGEAIAVGDTVLIENHRLCG